MDELEVLKKLERVKAPPDFEQNLLAQLPRRKERRLKARNLRLSLAGAFSVLFVVGLLLNIFVLQEKGSVEFAETKKGIPSTFQRGKRLGPSETIPIIEPVDFTREMRTVSRQPQTIYILEQVSEGAKAKIKF